MFQKFSHSILSALLLVSTMGMVVSKHYCGEKLVSVLIFDEAESCCDSEDCCHNESSFFQVKEDFSVPQVPGLPILTELEILGTDLFAETGLTLPEAINHVPVYTDTPPPPTIQKTLALKQLYLL